MKFCFEILNFVREMNSDDLTCSLCLGFVLSALERRIGQSSGHFQLVDSPIEYCKHQKDIFTPPIRMTEVCGHNFCQSCLYNLIAAQGDWNCPECRTPQTKRTNDLVRNRLVEKAVEQYNATQVQNQSKSLCSHHNMELSICESTFRQLSINA